MADRPRRRVQDRARRAQEFPDALAFGPLVRDADRRVREGGEDRADAFGDAAGAAQLGRAGAGLARGERGGVARQHQRFAVERGDRVVAQSARVVGLGGERVGQGVAVRAPSAYREEDHEGGLDETAEDHHRGVPGGVSRPTSAG